MLLASGLVYHEGALRASLMSEYGLRLSQVVSWPAREVADLVEWLPPGCAFWRAVGGPAAISSETRELRRVGFYLRVLDYRERGSKGEKPKPDPEPMWAHERRAEQELTDRKMAAYLRRQRG